MSSPGLLNVRPVELPERVQGRAVKTGEVLEHLPFMERLGAPADPAWSWGLDEVISSGPFQPHPVPDAADAL